MKRRSIYEVGGFTPTVYQGNAFEFKAPDAAFAERALGNIETRMNKAREQATAVDVALGEYQEKLHQDQTTLNWFNNYKQQISGEIDALIQEGNYGRAIRKAAELGGKMAKDDNIQSRIKDNEELTLRRKILETDHNNGKLNSDDYNYLLAKNDEEYLNRFDENGNYKEEYINEQAKFTLANNSINWSQELLNSKQLVEYKQESTTTTIGVPVAQNDGSTLNTTGTTAFSFTSLEADRIKSTFKNRLNNDLRASIQQDFESKKYKRKQLELKLANTTDENERTYIQKEIDNLNKVLLNTYTLEDYIDKNLDNQYQMIKDSSYYRTQNTKIDKASLSNSNKNGGGKGNKVEQNAKNPSDTTDGGAVEYMIDVTKGYKTIKSASQIVRDMMDDYYLTNVQKQNNVYSSQN